MDLIECKDNFFLLLACQSSQERYMASSLKTNLHNNWQKHAETFPIYAPSIFVEICFGRLKMKSCCLNMLQNSTTFLASFSEIAFSNKNNL